MNVTRTTIAILGTLFIVGSSGAVPATAETAAETGSVDVDCSQPSVLAFCPAPTTVDDHRECEDYIVAEKCGKIRAGHCFTISVLGERALD